MLNQNTIKTNYKYFIIAEILAVASFALNAFNVIVAKPTSGPGPSWNVNFGFIYWCKTILCIIGIVLLLKSRIFYKKGATLIVSICTIGLLLYSVPIINLIFVILTIMSVKFIIHETMVIQYSDRVMINLTWSILAIIVLIDLIKQLVSHVKQYFKFYAKF